MLKNQKYQNVATLKEIYSQFSSIILVNYRGLSVNQITKLRKSLKKNNAGFKVVKNTLSKIAMSDTAIQSIRNIFNGPVAIAYSSDIINLTKEIVNFEKENESLKIIGGITEGKTLSIGNIKKLSELPSLNILRGQLISLLQSPASKVARVINIPATNIVKLIKLHIDKNNN